MNTCYTTIILMLMSAASLCGAVKFPPSEVMAEANLATGSEYTGAPPNSVVFEDDDFDPAPIGESNGAAVKEAHRVAARLGQALVNAPDDATGKQSPWYPRLSSIKSSLDAFVMSRKLSNLVDTLPNIADFIADARSPTPAPLASSLSSVGTDFLSLGRTLVEAVGKFTEEAGSLSPSQAIAFSRLFAAGGFNDEGAWEDGPPPFDASALFILQPQAIAEDLKHRPVHEAIQFTRGSTDALEYFIKYSAGGSGSQSIKSVYDGNRSQIHDEFGSLVQWISENEIP